MQEHMEKVVIYGGGGVALIAYAIAAWRAGRVGLGTRFLGSGSAVERSQRPGKFKLFLAAYVLAGGFLLGLALYHGLQGG